MPHSGVESLLVPRRLPRLLRKVSDTGLVREVCTVFPGLSIDGQGKLFTPQGFIDSVSYHGHFFSAASGPEE